MSSEGVQQACGQAFHAWFQGAIGRQFSRLVRRRPKCVDHNLSDVGRLHYHRFDLAELDTIAPHLHLGIDASQEFDLAVGVDAAQVAGAVDASRGVVGQMQKIGNEVFFGEIIPVEIAPGQSNAGNGDLARLTVRNGLQVFSQDDHVVGGHGPPDSHGLARLQDRPGGGDRGFGGAIGIEHPPPRAMPALHKLGGAGFAAHHDQSQRRDILIEGGQQSRHRTHGADLASAQKIIQLLSQQFSAARCRDQRGSGHQRRPNFLHRKIEGDRHALIHSILLADAVHLTCHSHEIADGGMLDGHAFGPPGGARGVDDVAQIVLGRSLFRLG